MRCAQFPGQGARAFVVVSVLPLEPRASVSRSANPLGRIFRNPNSARRPLHTIQMVRWRKRGSGGPRARGFVVGLQVRGAGEQPGWPHGLD